MGVKGSSGVECGEVGEECGVDFADDVALEAADDLFLAEALCGASVHVGLGSWVVAHSGQGDGVEGAVGGAVAAAVEAVSGGGARAGPGGGHAPQVGPGGCAAPPGGGGPPR